MKIVRGMYESRWTAEYLRRNPKETGDYLEFSKVLVWRKLLWLQENDPAKACNMPKDAIKQISGEYEKVKPRFTNKRGEVRWQWSEKSLRQMATEIGHKLEYELPYNQACSIHHGNFEGMAAHFLMDGDGMEFSAPPSTQWVGKALLAAQTNLWFALNTLNDCCRIGFDTQLESAANAIKTPCCDG